MVTSALLPGWLRPCRDDIATAITVAAGATVAFHPRRGARIAVHGGRAWITQAGDARDHLPEAGGMVELASAGLVAVQNLGARSITIRCWNLRQRM